MAERGNGKGIVEGALSCHRVRQESSQKKCGDGGRPKSFERQLQELQWVAKMQRKATSKGEKGWARRQREKLQKKFAETWLLDLEEKAKASEVGKATANWDSTPARRIFDKAKKLKEEKEELKKNRHEVFQGAEASGRDRRGAEEAAGC